MPRKRKSTTSSAPSNKRRRSASAKAAKTFFPLLDLPPEILDHVLSYLIIIPWHPENGLFTSGLHRLFRRNVMQTNQYIRKQAIDFITRHTFWINIKCHTRGALSRLDPRVGGLPFVPGIFRQVLPDELRGVHLEVGQPGTVRRTRSFKEENASFVVPFNFYSWTKILCRLRGARSDVQFLTIWQDQLAPHLTEVIDQQVYPLVPLLRHDLDITIIKEAPEKKVYPRYGKQNMTCAFPRADDLLEAVLQLDTHGRKLEGTLLCMHYGFLLFMVADTDPYLGVEQEDEPLICGPVQQWATITGGLGQPDWRTNPANLERMRRARTLHYLEYRACLGYIAGVEEYGYVFVQSNYVQIANFPRLHHGSPRWRDDLANIFYGLPDHELAQVHHARALIYRHREKYYGQMYREGIIDYTREAEDDDDALSGALMWAYYAWSLDMSNAMYSRLLRDIVEECEDGDDDLIEEGRDQLVANHVLRPSSSSFRGHECLRQLWTSNGMTEEYVIRAQEVAKLADVAYDPRRRDELPCGSDDEYQATQEQFLFLACYSDHRCNYEEVCKSCRTGLNLEMLDVTDDIDQYEGVAPWRAWKM